MKRLHAFQVIQCAVALTVLFLILHLIVPPDVLITMFNGTFMGLVVAVFIVYTPLFWKSLRQRQFNRVTQLSLGIMCIWLSVAVARSTSIVSHIQGKKELVFTSLPIILSAYLALLGAALHVTAANTDDVTNVLGVRAKVLIMLAIVVAGGIAVALFYMQRYHVLP